MEVTVFKGKNPKELVVYHASSLEDEIRFYINETQYISAMENRNENISVELRNEAAMENKKDKNGPFLWHTIMLEEGDFKCGEFMAIGG